MDTIIEERFDRTDRRITTWMAEHGLLLLRIALGDRVPLVRCPQALPGRQPGRGARRSDHRAADGRPRAAARRPLPILAIWEIAIGIGLFIGRGMRITLLLLFVQMLGTITPLFLFPSETFTTFPLAPTLEGQYIIKNVVIIGQCWRGLLSGWFWCLAPSSC